MWARDHGLRAGSRRRSERRTAGGSLLTSKSGKQPGAPDLKALYTIAELCTFAGMSRYRLRRLLEQRGVKCIAVGEAPYVPLSEIEERIPELWRSLCSAISARRRDERSSRTTESSARMESLANRERYRAVRR